MPTQGMEIGMWALLPWCTDHELLPSQGLSMTAYGQG